MGDRLIPVGGGLPGYPRQCIHVSDVDLDFDKPSYETVCRDIRGSVYMYLT